jgi:hypothetical protein
MSARTLTFVAGLTGGLGWVVKVALIWDNDGTNTDEGIVAVLYFLGLASMVVAAAAAGVWVTAHRPVVVRVLAGMIGVVVVFGLFSLFDAVLSPLVSDGHWFQQEVEIVATAMVGLVLAWAARPVAAKDRDASGRPPAMRG